MQSVDFYIFTSYNLDTSLQEHQLHTHQQKCVHFGRIIWHVYKVYRPTARLFNLCL